MYSRKRFEYFIFTFFNFYWSSCSIMLNRTSSYQLKSTFKIQPYLLKILMSSYLSQPSHIPQG
ncbi:unnamed protein product [Meloidogyne enterolobii]|uniref:Uncharacterized protein n=1 Tax=Meloidogyne enterolobii TaxID=390850 RepID=A0ACB0ZZ17_MELEN